MTPFDVTGLIRPNIVELEPYHSARERIQQGVLLDANENPFPVQSEGILLNRYPDPFQRRLRQALAGYSGVKAESILAGAGSDEVLDWIFKIFCRPGHDQVAVAEPTYGMYRVMASIFGVALFEFRLGPEFNFCAADFLKSVPARVKVLFLCSPNNPTANLLNEGEILEVCRSWSGIVVLDEAYIEFAASKSLARYLDHFPNLIILRTLSKALGQAGLRLGYALASPQIISYFLKVKFPYNLSSIAQKRGWEALQNTVSSRARIEEILAERERLSLGLKRISGVQKVFPSQANFLLFRCSRAREVYARLFRQGIIVRDRSRMPGLEDCIRVTVGTPEENELFLGRLETALKEPAGIQQEEKPK